MKIECDTSNCKGWAVFRAVVVGELFSHYYYWCSACFAREIGERETKAERIGGKVGAEKRIG